MGAPRRPSQLNVKTPSTQRRLSKSRSAGADGATTWNSKQKATISSQPLTETLEISEVVSESSEETNQSKEDPDDDPHAWLTQSPHTLSQHEAPPLLATTVGEEEDYDDGLKTFTVVGRRDSGRNGGRDAG